MNGFSGVGVRQRQRSIAVSDGKELTLQNNNSVTLGKGSDS